VRLTMHLVIEWLAGGAVWNRSLVVNGLDYFRVELVREDTAATAAVLRHVVRRILRCNMHFLSFHR
jgi:hypothetical protein